MNLFRFKRKILVLGLLIGWLALGSHTHQGQKDQDSVRLIFLKQKVLAFAQKYGNQDVIIVSKRERLLFYCRNGKVVTNEKWQGFTYNFPVKVALAGKYYKTPEGEMYIDGKNPRSKFIRFLSFSNPGDYGLHSAPTRYAKYLEQMEKKDPNFVFATKKDDTRGCVQVENRVIKYLYAKADVNTPVLVMP
ncbi:hypothetical protein A3H38_01225 [candidate division WOR-1 bacterium RIFCSPLOWO2_02_FULL_46_20]|uniref:L,D-TPase catalytic domain-containing protein n=2 Tax=Saganbacteria TaxID=1703751 RepID=A0A1F4RCU4_UNCSA|nr:MAG: hypothetical protein A3J44_02470 [candidate division WOR-1 bacterium RIFCSPHIGHO2_02_FULL_45_12]OGC06002.1 MAG: hypothetical protein A3H38_01225 [candidate division WOR-1 bacterium RIFCSPLOWO2_02_FULL_46_20]OGC08371.1 MAG: hypothetical protein A3F86_01915 [candidate division WOR-1 bacterium RIFCSPLOWO2_12_FULL_45_9]